MALCQIGGNTIYGGEETEFDIADIPYQKPNINQIPIY
jgi:hypothetical protein